MRYLKPVLCFADQVALLQARGLIIRDPDFAEQALSHISYYRLSAYLRPYRIQGSERIHGATFEDVLALYEFDKKLRVIVGDALEVIEVHIRTRLTYHLALRGGAFAHLDAIYFTPAFNHPAFLQGVRQLEEQSSDAFVQHFRNKYSEEPYLPIWMITELMSFGFLSRVYKALTTDLQREIAQDLGIHQSVLRTWLHTLSYIRNICAHHARLWNRELAIAPRFPAPGVRWPYAGVEPKRVYGVIVLIWDLLKRVGHVEEYEASTRALLASATPLQLAGMRAPMNWVTLQPWTTHKGQP